jgi:catechol 2,3-dioxygenase-like lactoylglutathione lyase family enzyme
MPTDTIQLGPLRQIAQRATDVGRAVVFYRDVLGLPLLAMFGESLAFFDLDGTRLMIESGGEGGEASGSVLYFAVPDIHAAHRELLARGVVFEDEPHAIHRDDAGTFGPAGEEEWMTFFRDPEGNLLSLASRQAPA